MFRKSKIWVALGLMGVHSGAYALGLGAIEVRSGLNEPLVAEIALSATPAELGSLNAQLAAATEFERLGLDASRLRVELSFEVTRNARGEDVIRITSNGPVKDPYLSFLIEVNWGQGKLYREVTILLDPPTFAPLESSNTAVVATQLAEPESIEAIEVPEPSTEVESVAAEPAPEPVAMDPEPVPADPPTSVVQEPAAARAGTGQYGPVRPGETLWEVAQKTKPSGTTNINQMMVALLQLNPEAFYEQNINALKRGAILRVPDQAEIDALAVSEAQQRVNADNAQWREYRTRAATAAPVVRDLPADSATVSRATEPDPELRLVPPLFDDAGAVDRPSGADAQTSADLERVRADLQRAREDAAAVRQEADELRDRVSELERIKSESESLISVQNDRLKMLEEQLAEARAAADAKPQSTATTTVAATDTTLADADPSTSLTDEATDPMADDVLASGDDVAVDPLADDGANDSLTDLADPIGDADDSMAADDNSMAADDSVATEVPLSSEPPIDQATTVATVAPPVTAPVVTPPVVTPPVVTTPPATTTNWTSTLASPWVAGSLIGVAVLGVAGFNLMRRRRPQERGSLASAIVGGGAPAAADGDSREADLLDLITADPQNAEIRLDLIRHYYQRQDASNFDAQVRDLKVLVADDNDPLFNDVRAMADQLIPGHDLFPVDDLGLPESLPERIEDTADALADLDLGQNTERAGDITGEFNYEPSGPDFDFDLDAASAAPSPTPPSPAPAPTTQFAAPPKAPPVAAVAPPEDDFSIDFEPVELPPLEPVKPVSGPVVSRYEDGLDFKLEAGDLPARPEQATKPMRSIAAELEDAAPAADSFTLDTVDGRSEPMDLGLDLDLPSFDFESEPIKPEVIDPVEELVETKSGSTSFDLDIDDDAVATKLDLAKAYIEMGDPEGARGMLEEVLSEGNERQRKEAQQLIASL